MQRTEVLTKRSLEGKKGEERTSFVASSAMFGPPEMPLGWRSVEADDASSETARAVSRSIVAVSGVEILIQEGGGNVVGTGCVVSGSAATFIEFLHSRSIAGNVVELGAGTGVVSIALAAFGCHVLATDANTNPHGTHGGRSLRLQSATMDDAHASGQFTDLLRVIELNAGLNRALVQRVGGTLNVAALLWGEAEQLSAILARYRDGFDVVVGCNITYQPPLYDALLATVRALSTERTVTLFATTDNLGDNARLAEAAEVAGMHMRQVFADPATYTIIFELKLSDVSRAEPHCTSPP